MRRLLTIILSLASWTLAAPRSHAQVRLDMFVGYDSIVCDYAWFPITFEVKNEGPSFVGRVEISDATFGTAWVRSFSTELPTGTLKRFCVPMVNSERYRQEWKARLLDPEGRVRAESSQQVRRHLPWNGSAIGALPRSSAGMPSLPKLPAQANQIQPAVGRLLSPLFPDNPLALEGLNVLYLNSEKAFELKAPQVDALIAWLYGGGQLIVCLEQLGDLNGAPWLRRILPELPNAMKSARVGEAMHKFATQNWPYFSNTDGSDHPSNLSQDITFSQSELSFWKLEGQGSVRVLEAGSDPLVLSAPRGRGNIRLLAFNPEREPFTSWSHRSWFWASLCGTREQIHSPSSQYTYRTTDGVFGLIVDSTQIRKLPVGWLLVLLVAYLFVIGPLDRWWLRKLNREMLTWITFPCYVALFSGLIYLIGYRLRAGDTEWNELQVVDVIPIGETNRWRTRAFGVVYSPVNRRYHFASESLFASFRPEMQLQGGLGMQYGRIEHAGRGFTAAVSVPVWTSQLFIQDSWSTNALSLRSEARGSGAALELTVDNQLGRNLAMAYFVTADQVYKISRIAQGRSTISKSELMPMGTPESFINEMSASVSSEIESRRETFGHSRTSSQDRPLEKTLFGSFSRLVRRHSEMDYSGLAYPPGLDLTVNLERGDGVLIGWAKDHAATPLSNAFEARRGHKDTAFRLVVPMRPSRRIPE